MRLWWRSKRRNARHGWNVLIKSEKGFWGRSLNPYYAKQKGFKVKTLSPFCFAKSS